MRLAIILLITLSIILSTSTIPTFASDGFVSTNGALRVEGAQLVNHQGSPIQLRGMSSHGLRWYPEYINYAAMTTIKQYGANLFRLAMYADSNNGGYNESWDAEKTNKQFMYLGIENALAADMYVIADWHLLEDQNPLYNADKAVAFFEEISSRYPDNPAVIYEICNEPNGATTWEDISAYAQRVIPVIREKSPNAVILVGTPFWAQNVLAVRENPLDFPNVMYTYHLYTGNSDYDYIHKLDSMREAGLPVFVSEWGFSIDKKDGQLDVKEGIAFIEYMRKHKISWVNWSLSNKDEEYSAIRPEVTKFSGWTEDDLTTSGKLIFEAFKSLSE